MARLRSRLIGGGGQGSVGFGSGLAQAMNSMAQQMAQAQDPAYQQAIQFQRAKMQEIQARTQAQQAAMQAETEDQAAYNQLAERIFPSGGRTVTETGPPQIETESGDIPVGNQLTERNQPLTDNDLLLKQLVRSRNQKILQAIALQQQQPPSGPPPVFDIGGGHQVIQQPGGNYAFVPREPKETAEKTLNPNDLAAFVASDGALRGPSIPADMTPEQGKATLNSIRSIAQQHISIQQQQIDNKTAPKGTYVTSGGDVNPNVFSLNDAHQHANSGGIFLPQGSPSEKVKTGSDLFDTHINGALDMYEATPDANKGGRVSSYLKNSWAVFANDPAKVALFQFYGAATPFATSSVYNSMTNGRGSALMAQMLDPTGIEKGDNDATGLNKLYVGESLAREAAVKRGIPTVPYDKTISRIQSIARRRNVPLIQQFGTGTSRGGQGVPPPPPAGFR